MSAAYQAQYSATVERQLIPGLTATAGYRGITGMKTFRSRDANAPLFPYTKGRPDPALGFVQQVEADGRSRLNAIDLGIAERHLSGLKDRPSTASATPPTTPAACSGFLKISIFRMQNGAAQISTGVIT